LKDFHTLTPSLHTGSSREQGVENTQDSILAQRAAAGEGQAFAQLYDAHFSFVRSISRQLGTPEGDLDDVAQEAFVVAHKQLRHFNTGKFTTWLYKIVSNIVANRHRSRNVRNAFSKLLGQQPEAFASAADRQYERSETQHQVAQVLAAMAHKKREVFAMYELEGLTGEEIAERLNCKVDTVWSRLHYARAEFESIARKRGLP
jgi:RNA polymerase sigma-70 factor, ECF subfamily